MQSAHKFTAPILPGRRIEISSPDLPETGEVELIVVLPESTGPTPVQTVAEFLDCLPNRTYTEEEWAEVEAALKEGRNSWDR